MCQRITGIDGFLICIILRSQFHQKRPGTQMHIVSVSLQIDSAGQTRVILRSLQLHLKRKCQICLLILIPEIIDISCLARAAESVKEHKFSGGSALQFRHQSGVLRHFIGKDTVYDCTKANLLLNQSGISCPPVDEKLFAAYLNYFKKNGCI